MIYRYGWDVRNRLQTVRTSTSINRTTNIYDPTGQRILTQTPTGVVTVYLGGLEIRFQGGSGGPRAAKHPVAGVTIGYDTIRSYTTHNHQQSIAHNTTPTSTTDSYYQPYGKMPIADTTTIIADRSYLNQITDTTTGLNYLNQRHYNASAG
ncbi:MAG: hypothetical protein ACRDTD_24255, partial [Pseudonocardiaceae bacterium]